MKEFKNPFKNIYLLLILAFMYLPIAVMVIYSFNESREMGTWTGFSFEWYKELFQDEEIMQALLYTVLLAIISSIISTIVGTITALGLHGYGKRSKALIMNITYIPVVNPDIVTGISLMLLFIFAGMGSSRGFLTILISHIVFSIPYVIFSVMPKLRQINFSKYEAAQDLGASPSQALRKVILPELLPGILSGFMLAFTLSLDDFVVTFFTKGNGVQNLSTVIYAMTKRGITPKLNALSTLMFLAILILLIIINVYQSKGRKKRDANMQAARNAEMEFEMQNSVKTQDHSLEERK